MTNKNLQINLAKKLLKIAGYPVIYEPTDTYEMTPLKKKYTGLPMNIWIDELQKYKIGKHEIYVKFQLDTEDELKPFKKVGAINLDGEIKEYKKSCKLTELELDALKIFVINNSEAIKKIADCVLLLSDIEKHFIKGTKKANKKRKEKLNSIIQENIVK